MESAKEYLAGFRMPDLKKLWYGTDFVDGPPPKPLIVQFEAYLVKLQELSLWTDPKSSVLALVVVHAIYWYLSLTTNSTVYLLAMVALLSFVYTTWTQRIWPEIRVPDANPTSPEPEWTPVSPDVLSAPDLVRLWNEVKAKSCQGFQWLKELRVNEHGKFCALVSTFFVCLAYVGSRITTLGLFYYVSVGYLIVPGVLKILVKYPAVHCMLETMEEFKNPKKVEEVVVKAEETKATSLADSVYATLQTGLNAVSNLNLKAEAAKHDDDLKSYLPEEDEANQSILESAMNSSIKDPMQAHKLDQEEVS